MIDTFYKKGLNFSFNRRVTSVRQPHQGWRTFSESLWVGAPLHCALHDLTRVLWDGFRQDLLRLRSGIPPLLYGRPRLQKEKSSSANIFKVMNTKSFEEEKITKSRSKLRHSQSFLLVLTLGQAEQYYIYLHLVSYCKFYHYQLGIISRLCCFVVVFYIVHNAAHRFLLGIHFLL